MAFNFPLHVSAAKKQLISDILWCLKTDGNIYCATGAVRELQRRLEQHGVRVESHSALRATVVDMDGGRYGQLLEREISGRHTKALVLVVTDLPPNSLPDAAPASPAVEPDPPIEVAVETTRPALPVPQLPPVPLAPVDDDFDLVAVTLQCELEELRNSVPPAPDRPDLKERLAAERNLADRDELVNTILRLTGDLAALLAGEPVVEQTDIELKDRLADAIERSERFRRSAIRAQEALEGRSEEVLALRKQLAVKDGQIARLEANIVALQSSERVADDRAIRVAQGFISARPHHRRGADEPVYSVGG